VAETLGGLPGNKLAVQTWWLLRFRWPLKILTSEIGSKFPQIKLGDLRNRMRKLSLRLNSFLTIERRMKSKRWQKL